MDIRTQPLHQRRISEAHIAVAQRINPGRGIVPGGAAGLVRNAQQLEAVARGRVDEVGALDVDGLHGAGELGGAGEREESDLGRRRESQ